MPTYEYVCQNGHKTEAIKRVETKSIVCPRCKCTAERIMSVPARPVIK